MPVWKRVSSAQGPLCANVSSEFQKPRRTNRAMDSEPAGVKFYFRAPPRPEAEQCGCTFPTTLPRRIYELPQRRRTGRNQTCTRNCRLSRSRLVSGDSKNGAVNDPIIEPILQDIETGERPQGKDIADRSPNVQKLLGSVDIVRCKNGILERNWESANGLSQIAQIILPRSRMSMC
jgi:hypothetical protein